MYCEFCDLPLYNLCSARKHMLSIEHHRKRRSIEMSELKFAEVLRHSESHPRDLYELLKLINVHSARDVVALDSPEEKFFNLTTKRDAQVARAVMDTLHEEINNYNFKKLPIELRMPLFQAWLNRNSDTK